VIIIFYFSEKKNDEVINVHIIAITTIMFFMKLSPSPGTRRNYGTSGSRIEFLKYPIILFFYFIIFLVPLADTILGPM